MGPSLEMGPFLHATCHQESISLCLPPQACKMFNYTHRRHICDALFVIFSLVFLYTRLVLFPTQ